MPGGLEIGNAPCILFSRNIPEQLHRSEQLPISPGRYPINRLAFSSVVRVAKMAMASEEPPLSTFNPQSVRCRLPSARRWFRLVHRCWRHRRLTCRSFRSSPRSLIISFSPQLCVGVVLSAGAGISISYSASWRLEVGCTWAWVLFISSFLAFARFLFICCHCYCLIVIGLLVIGVLSVIVACLWVICDRSSVLCCAFAHYPRSECPSIRAYSSALQLQEREHTHTKIISIYPEPYKFERGTSTGPRPAYYSGLSGQFPVLGILGIWFSGCFYEVASRAARASRRLHMGLRRFNLASSTR